MKATVQPVGKAMTYLVVLQHHLWLNLTEIRDAEIMVFLNSPISPKGLTFCKLSVCPNKLPL